MHGVQLLIGCSNRHTNCMNTLCMCCVQTIDKQTFRGVNLQHLFLNGNRNMQLVAGSFQGLVTTGLYLHDCSLGSLEPTVLQPIRSTVKYLWLNGNDVASFDASLESAFSSMQHLRLGENPLRCDCSAVWLKRLYDNKPELFRGAAAPSCRNPDRLRGRAFNDTSVDEFRCRHPQLTRVELAANSTSGRLTCAAAGEPLPTIYWIEPSGTATRYVQSDDNDDDERVENEGTLVVESESRLFGMYICIANNDAGNVTLTINVPAVSTSSSDQLAADVMTTTTSSTSVTSASVQLSTSVERWSVSDHSAAAVLAARRRHSFTLSQLVLAVVVTHTVTLLLYVALVALCYWTPTGLLSRQRRHSGRRVHHHHHRQRSTVCSGSTLYTAASLHSISAQSPISEADPAVFADQGTAAHQRNFVFDAAVGTSQASVAYAEHRWVLINWVMYFVQCFYSRIQCAMALSCDGNADALQWRTIACCLVYV